MRCSQAQQQQNFATALVQRKQHAAHHIACPGNVKRLDLFTFIRRSMYFTAMYPLPLVHYLPRVLRCVASALDAIYEVFLYFVLLHINILYMCTIYFNFDAGDLELLVSCMIQTVIYTWAMIVKVYFKRIKPLWVDELMQCINREHTTHSALGFTYVTMRDCLAQADFRTRAFVYSGYVGVVFWLFMPLISQDRSLPLPCWYPIDYKAPIIYEVIYFLQAIGQVQVAGAFSCTSCYFMMISTLMSGQFDVLNCSLKNILATTYITLRRPKAQLIELREQQKIADPERNQHYCSIEEITNLDCIPHLLVDANVPQLSNFKVAFKQAFVSCVVQHRYILKMLAKLERLYTTIWFLKTFQVTFLICLVVFDWMKSTSAKSLFAMASLGQYLVLVLWEMLIICYSGEMVFLNSQRCDEALLRSPWYLHMTEVRSDILLFLLNAQRPFRLTGGKLYNLNVNKFRSILTTSFSLITILQKMDERTANAN